MARGATGAPRHIPTAASARPTWTRTLGTGDGTGGGVRRDRAGTDEPLTAQETRVALLVADGLTNKEVAAALFLSPRTVEHHVGSVLRKRGLRFRTQLAAVVAGGGQRAPVARGDTDLR